MSQEKATYEELKSQVAELRKELVEKDRRYSELSETINHGGEENEGENLVLDNIVQGYAHCQMFFKQNEPIDFKFIKVNNVFEGLTGIKDAEGRQISEILENHKDENPELFELYGRVAQTGVSERIETYVPSISAWLNISAFSVKKNYFHVIFDNITEIKASQKKLKERKELLKSLEEIAHIGSYDINLENGKAIWSDETFKIFGLDPIHDKEPSVEEYGNYAHPEDIEGINALLAKCIETGERFDLIYRIVKANKEVRHVHSIGEVFKDENGNPYKMLGTFEDITERIQVENQLRELNASKDKLVSIIAHDLRGPFNGIIGFSDLLIKNIEKYDPEKINEIVTLVNKSAKDTLNLLDNLLAWERSQTGKLVYLPKTINLSSLIQEIIDIMHPSTRIKDVELKFLQSIECEAYADPDMLLTVLRNLVSNAIKFTNPKGIINIILTQKEEFVEVTVSDNGIGMDEKMVMNLFRLDSIFSTEGTDNEKGSGLGLLLCKEFVEKNHGKIWVESIPGKGSDFKFTLPIRKIDL